MYSIGYRYQPSNYECFKLFYSSLYVPPAVYCCLTLSTHILIKSLWIKALAKYPKCKFECICVCLFIEHIPPGIWPAAGIQHTLQPWSQRWPDRQWLRA